MLHFFGAGLSSAKSGVRKRSAKNIFWPRLEYLEDRVTPSTIPVNTFADETIAGDGKTSLREAILQSNVTPGPNTITLQAGTYNLTQGTALLINTNNLTITGQGAGLTTVNALGLSRVFEISGPGLTVKFGKVKITGGLTGGNGGGVDMTGTGTLIFSGANVSGNTAEGSGAAIYQEGGNGTFTNSTLSNNVAGDNGGRYYNNGVGSPVIKISGSNVLNNRAYNGGGIYSNGGASLTNSNVSGNTAIGSEGGGGIVSYSSTFTLTGCNVNNNKALYNRGGGIYFATAGATLTSTSSHIDGNTAEGDGGGISLNSTNLVLISSTVNGNVSTSSYGGGVSYVKALTMTNSQINNNSAFGAGGGVYQSSDGSVSLSKSTINGNSVSGTASGNGGGIAMNGHGSLTMTDSSINGNSASKAGGGVYHCEGATLTNSHIDNNKALGGEGGGIANDKGTINLTGSSVRLGFCTYHSASPDPYPERGGNGLGRGWSCSTRLSVGRVHGFQLLVATYSRSQRNFAA